MRIEASPDGILAEIDRRLEDSTETVDTVSSNLQEVVQTNISFSQEIESLANTVDVNSRQFVSLTDELASAQTLSNAPLNNIRQNIQIPTVRGVDLRLRRESLQSIRPIQ